MEPLAAQEHKDKYSSFAELVTAEREGVDYRIRSRPGPSGTAIMAPHGGEIEAGTSEIAHAVAAEGHSFYSFEGTKARGNRFLHIRSTRFDEPRGMQLANESQAVVTIHGCKGNEALVYLGGLDSHRKEKIRCALTQAGFSVAEKTGLLGKSARNLCNRASGGAGVQLELTTALRTAMFCDLTKEGRTQTTQTFEAFVKALGESLNGHCAGCHPRADEAMEPPQMRTGSEC
jgi:phage replication-related protein YjqB (UPF0714/DUF867 family)